MVSRELQQIIDQLMMQGKFDFRNATTEAKISQFEEKNHFKLPSKFREWLQYSDGGELFLPAGVQFYGVAEKPLIDVNDDDRPDDSYVVIGALSNGDPILCRKDSEEIAIYNQEAGRIEDDERYEDFFAFLKDLYNILGIGG